MLYQGKRGIVRPAGEPRPGTSEELESWRAKDPYGLLSSSSHMVEAVRNNKRNGNRGFLGITERKDENERASLLGAVVLGRVKLSKAHSSGNDVLPAPMWLELLSDAFRG